MGGYGSTRWYWHRAKRTVEASLGLNITVLCQRVQIGDFSTGSISWPSGASVSFFLAGLSLTLSYRVQRRPDDSWQERRDVIALEATRPNYGGLRWWFSCPICQRRAGWVYLDRRYGRFTCRRCAGLVYRSQQQHDKTMDKYACNPALALKALSVIARSQPGQASAGQLIQAMKALDVRCQLDMHNGRKRRRQ